MKQKNGVPYITLTGKSAPRSDENVYIFDAVTAIIKNKETGLYLALEFIREEFGLVGGKVEDGEDKNMAVLREVEEETGYANATLTMVLFEEIYGRGYKARKNREEEGRDKVFVVEVEDQYRQEILGADVGTKGVFWFSEEEMLEKLTLTHHLFYFKEYLKQST